MPRDELAATLIAVADAALVARASSATLHAHNVTMSLPIEMRWGRGRDGAWLRATLPRWRWRTVFDRAPDRVRLTWSEEVRP